MCKIKKCADLLVEAHRVPGKLITAWPEGMQPKTIEEGYKIAAEVDKALGLSLVGYKVVCTPRTRNTYNIEEPLFGRIYSKNVVNQASSTQRISDFNQPRFEPHYTFKMEKDLTEKIDAFSLQDKIAFMKTSVEISSSRYDGPPENSESLAADYVADNCRSGLLLTGEPGAWKDTDMATVQSKIFINKREEQFSSNNQKNNSLSTLMTFLNSSFENKIPIKRGQLISVVLDYGPQFVNPGDEAVVYTPGMTEVTVYFKE